MSQNMLECFNFIIFSCASMNRRVIGTGMQKFISASLGNLWHIMKPELIHAGKFRFTHFKHYSGHFALCEIKL